MKELEVREEHGNHIALDDLPVGSYFYGRIRNNEDAAYVESPKIFYRGNKVIKNEVLKINCFDVREKVWVALSGHWQIPTKDVDLTEEEKLSLVPFLCSEPASEPMEFGDYAEIEKLATATRYTTYEYAIKPRLPNVIIKDVPV